MSQPAIAAPNAPRRTPSEKKPGDFHARCNLRRQTPEKKMNSTEISAAPSQGGIRKFVTSGRGGAWVWSFPACGGFETDDPAAFERHMAEEHNRKTSNYAASRGEAEPFARSINAGWSAPRLGTEGRPLSKAAAALLQTCPTCELVAEVDTKAGELWWREHLNGCALAQAGAAS